LIPATFVLVDALPLTPSGKLDRRALPAPDNLRPGLNDSFVAPSGALEQVLANIWSEVLKVEKVGTLDSFFELGGDSILSLQVLSRIRRTLQMEVPLRALFEEPTIAGLVRVLRRDADAGTDVERIAELALSLAQLSEAEVEEMLAARPS